MSTWTDARDNVKAGIVAMWAALSPSAHSFIYGLVTGVSCAIAWRVLW